MLVKALLGFAALLPLAAHAEQIVLPWSTDSDSASTLVIETEPETVDLSPELKASVDFSSSGFKAVYFRIRYLNGKTFKPSMTDYCNPVGYSEKGVITINGQPIKVFMWCNKFTDMNVHYEEMVPETDAGKAFVIKTLSGAKGNVLVKVGDNEFELSSTGFTAIWSKSSDKAL